MSLSSRTIKVTYTAAGGSTFALPDVPLVSDSAEVKVYLRDESTTPATVTLQTEGALNDYTLTGAPLPGEFNTTVSFNSAPTSGLKVVIHLELPLTQLVDLTVSNGIPPATLELALDRAVGQIQQINEILGRVPKLGITEQIAVANMVMPEPSAYEVIGWNDAGTALTSYTAAELSLIGAGFETTDDLPEGATNLYYTNARADARIATASIDDLSDVTITTPANGQALVYNGSAWVNQAAGGGGGSILWSEQALAPVKTQLYGGEHYSFEDTLTQYLYTIIKVPSSYVSGNQINLITTFFTPTITGNVLLQSLTTLIRVGTDAMSSTTNQRTSTNAASTVSGTANVPKSVSLDLTSSIGEINAVAVSPGDYLLVRLTRDVGTDTLADTAYVTTDASEVTFV